MTTLVRQEQSTLTRNDMLAEGFTPSQVDALEALRDNYPYIEFFDSRKELEHLRFMKWMIGRKQVSRS